MRAFKVARLSFSGHETFPFRYAWLPKAVQRVQSCPDIFTRDDAMVELGVGKNMVRSIRHWGLTAGMLEEVKGDKGSRARHLAVSELGRRLFSTGGWDPYLEDPATLWLLHWQIASHPDGGATTWFWSFNHLPQPEFTREELTAWLIRLTEDHPETRASPASLQRDIDCFIRSYVPARASRVSCVEDTLDCPLVELELIREVGKGTYLLARGEQPSLPDDVLAFSLASFVRRRETELSTVSLPDLAFSPGSPGTVFCLSEEGLLRRLEKLEALTEGAFCFDETAGLKQLLVRRSPNPLELLEGYYGRRGLTSARKAEVA